MNSPWLIEDLELEVAQKSQAVSGAIDQEDLAASKELLAARRALIAQLKKTRAKGRVIIHLIDDGKVEGTLGDILLEDGDRLEIPEKMNVVSSESAKKGFFVSGNSGLMTAKVQPGDSVIVPEKILQVRLMKDVKDITQILMQIAVTAGVLIALF